MVDKGLLHRMERAVFDQAFDCCDLRAVLHDRERQAGIDPATIDQDRAGAALAVVATLFCPGQADVNPERIEKRRPRREIECCLRAADDLAIELSRWHRPVLTQSGTIFYSS